MLLNQAKSKTPPDFLLIASFLLPVSACFSIYGCTMTPTTLQYVLCIFNCIQIENPHHQPILKHRCLTSISNQTVQFADSHFISVAAPRTWSHLAIDGLPQLLHAHESPEHASSPGEFRIPSWYKPAKLQQNAAWRIYYQGYSWHVFKQRKLPIDWNWEQRSHLKQSVSQYIISEDKTGEIIATSWWGEVSSKKNEEH